MSRYAQDLVNAQVSVNRAVWAMNKVMNNDFSRITSFNNASDAELYMLQEAKKAREDLSKAIITLNKKLSYGRRSNKKGT